MGSFPQSFLSIVWLDRDMYLGRYDLSWPYDVHLVTLMVWSKMAEYSQITVFPILSIWEPCSSHFSVLCPWLWTFVPKNQAYYRLAIYILPIFSSPVSYCHGGGVCPWSVVRRPWSVVRGPSSVNFFLSAARSQTWLNGFHSYWQVLWPMIGPWCTLSKILVRSNMAAIGPI